MSAMTTSIIVPVSNSASVGAAFDGYRVLKS
jgi:hypothetical protein